VRLKNQIDSMIKECLIKGRGKQLTNDYNDKDNRDDTTTLPTYYHDRDTNRLFYTLDNRHNLIFVIAIPKILLGQIIKDGMPHQLLSLFKETFVDLFETRLRLLRGSNHREKRAKSYVGLSEMDREGMLYNDMLVDDYSEFDEVFDGIVDLMEEKVYTSHYFAILIVFFLFDSSFTHRALQIPKTTTHEIKTPERHQVNP
jgi:hypothetical protein